jgi:radical SAM-linked protein
MTITGDLRFASHHDTMRAVQRTMARANLPVHYSQGFNPRPVFSLAAPRPVGVASECDLLVVALDEDGQGPLDGETICARLNGAAVRGMRFVEASLRPKGAAAPQPDRMQYRLPLRDRQAEGLRERIEQLNRQDEWLHRRGTHRSAGRRRGKKPRTVDIKPLVKDLTVEPDRLTLTLAPAQQRWAKPAEILDTLGLDPQGDLARLVRTDVRYAS